MALAGIQKVLHSLGRLVAAPLLPAVYYTGKLALHDMLAPTMPPAAGVG